jgi:hypothetical protein
MAVEQFPDIGRFKPLPDTTPANRYRVKLRDNAAEDVEANSPYEAIEKYKKNRGILATIHTFDVEPLIDG